MKYKTLLLFSLGAFIFIILSAGIGRHDVKETAYLKLAAEKQFDCVGRLFKDTSLNGSCVLISDRYVLSAAHVFIDSDSRPDTLNVNGQTVVVYNQYNHRVTDVSSLIVEFKGQKVKVKHLWIHPNYIDSLTEGSCDIAILELDKPIKNISPAILNTAFNELNSNAVGVGFGASGPADRPELVSARNKKIAGENIVDSIGGQSHLGFNTVLICDFDHPTRNDCNLTGSSMPRPLEYTTSGGDSGGGLFRKNNTTWELIGICSSGGINIEQMMKTGYYGQTMEWTRVSVFTQWINEHKR